MSKLVLCTDCCWRPAHIERSFRKAGNIVRSLESELNFYGRVFGFAPADEIVPVDIKNLA